MKAITEQQMKEAAKCGLLQPLTLAAAQALQGKAIHTIYYGYNGQDGVDTFHVGEIITELQHIHSINPTWNNTYSDTDSDNPKNSLHLTSAEGRHTSIRLHPYNVKYDNSTFHCSDTDRLVYYMQA